MVWSFKWTVFSVNAILLVHLVSSYHMNDFDYVGNMN